MAFVSRHIPLPTPLLAFILLSVITCVPLLVLSTLNYGILSLWLNASVAVLTLAFHITILYLSWQRRTAGFYASSTSSPPPSRSGSLSSKVPFPLTIPTIIAARNPVIEITRPSAAYAIASLTCLSILCTISVIAFGSTVSLTLQGLQSLLPTERVSVRPWNKQVQIAQSVVLGVHSLLLSVMFLICLLGRRKVHSARRERKDEVIYGLRTPVSGSRSEKSWKDSKALELA